MRDHQGRTIDFGWTAPDYDRFRPGFPESFFDTLERRGWLPEGGRAIDLGTGTGSVALGLARRGLRAVGVDLSAPLIEVARERARRDGLDATFHVARAEATGVEAESADLVTAGQCWWWLDEQAALAEIRRVLVPGGRALICDFSYLPLKDNLAEQTERLVLDHNPGWTMAGWHGIHPEQVQALDRGGFDSIESLSYVEPVTFTREAWRGRIRTCNAIGSSLPDEAVEAFDRELAALLERGYPEEFEVPHRVFVATGRRLQGQSGSFQLAAS